ncbi:unnamed protein product [Pleuronectes platessa]|uniref:Uncharacterized protein n=1 Tax=Pleuronectes platessa TaxID=8262 RepID=A0A9N7TWE6_PLEPL|nr:unnamed protein product [Pleuronectes platessa]
MDPILCREVSRHLEVLDFQALPSVTRGQHHAPLLPRDQIGKEPSIGAQCAAPGGPHPVAPHGVAGAGAFFLLDRGALSIAGAEGGPLEGTGYGGRRRSAAATLDACYGEWIVPNLRIPWKRRRSSLPYIAMGTCEILNGIDWDYRRETSGDVTATAW